MAPSRRKGGTKAAAAAAAAAAREQWKVGDLVLAKVKGFPAWPATVSEPEKWGYSSDWKKVLVYFFGTNQIAFCNPADVEEFTEEKKQSLLVKRHGRSSDFVRAVREIVDRYEKLQEQNQGHGLNSVEVPEENAAVGNSDVKNTATSPRTVSLRLKHSDFGAKKNESSPIVEDAGAAMEVDALKLRGQSEEPADNLTPDVTVPHTCILRKKSRSMHPQRFVTQSAVSVRRSRSSLRLNSRRSEDGTMPPNYRGKNAGDGSTNGSDDGFVRRNKRTRKLPDENIRNIVESSAVCNYNGNVEDNGSEIELADSDTLSNSEGSTTESNCKLEQSEDVAGCCEDLELSKRLDLQTKTVIVRKKRKPGRRRVTIDVVESVPRPDQDVNLGTMEGETTQHLQLCENHTERCLKDDGDEHLPLLKRARVRMAEEHDILIKEMEISSVAASTNVLGQVGTSSDGTHDECSKKNGMIENSSLACLLPSDISEDKSELLKSGKSQSSGFSLDGEAALPPSKRLHRALEAMSANAAEEVETCANASPSLQTCNNGCLADFTKVCSGAITEQQAEIHLEVQNESFDWNNNCQDDSSILFTSSKSMLEGTVKSSEYASVSNSSLRNLENLEDDSMKDKFEETVVCLDAKGLSGSVDVARAAEAACEVRRLQGLVDDTDGGDVSCRPEKIVLNELSPEERKTENIKLDYVIAKNDSKPDFVALFEVSSNTVLDGEADNVKCQDSIAVIPCSGEDKSCETLEILKPSTEEDKHCGRIKCLKPEIDESTGFNDLCDNVKEVEHFSEAMNVDAAASPILLKVTTGPDLGSVAGERSHDQNVSSNASPKQEHASDVDGHRKLDSGVYHGEKPAGKGGNCAEVKAGLASLEIILSTLTRTKDSIARATRIAIDCAKFGVADEVVDILAHYLEREQSLYKRVDLFFLVDSIAQCSRGLRGGLGDLCTSAIQAALPRLLAAAAPSGYAARENRRQCHKVLKLWLERRILSESIIRQHIRDLDSLSCSSSTGAYSRRMSRTERSFDDPVREMEGMLDEYGSNSSIEFPGFCMPHMLKVQEDGSDSDGESFEAVTPEHETVDPENSEATSQITTEKHRHVLAAVDGELEMEDVAPSCEAEMRQATSASGVSGAHSLHPSAQQFPSSYAALLTHDMPPSAPPLPASPPPPPPPPPPIPHAPTISHHGVDSQVHLGRHNIQETVPPQPPGPGIPPQMQIADSTSCSFSSYPAVHAPVGPATNLQQADANLHGNGYHLRPPLPTPSNQFSYFQADQQPHQQREASASASAPSYCAQSQVARNMEGGHFYSDHDRNKLPRHELNQRWKLHRPTFHGPQYSDKVKAYGPPSYHSPREPTRTPNHGWGFPPRPMHHRNHAPVRPFSEAPSYWQPR
ncbi:hypothetical protein Ancab_021917 [Ancistrocladus abbreviatus]